MVAICPLCGGLHTVVGPYKYTKHVVTGDIICVNMSKEINNVGSELLCGKLMYCENEHVYVPVYASHIVTKVDSISDEKIDLD